MELDALIVGAGPVGLMMASELTRHGMKVKLIDKREQIGDISRALTLHVRTQEIFEDIGIIDTVISQGIKLKSFNMVNGNNIIASIEFSGIASHYQQPVNLRQEKTEAILAQHLSEQGLNIQRNTTFEAFEQSDKKVIATLSSGETIEAGWLIACDGAHSQIRKQLSVEFDGKSLNQQFWLADVEIDWELEHQSGYAFFHEKGSIVCIPIKDHHYRIVIDVDIDGKQTPTIDDIKRAFKERGPENAAILSHHWLGGFDVNQRQVESYRLGRVFLAGDAAHVHSPAGGQGLNTGIQDAYNLAWKLALVHHGFGKESLLDSYHAERHLVGQHVLQSTENLTKLMTLKISLTRFIRDKSFWLVSNVKFLRDGFIDRLSELNVNYHKSPIVFSQGKTTLAKGTRAPEVMFENSKRVHELLHDTKHHLFIFNGAQQRDDFVEAMEGIANAISKKYSQLITPHLIFATDQKPARCTWEGSVILDSTDDFHQAYSAKGPSICLVRPDGYIGCISDGLNTKCLHQYLETILV